MSVVRQPLAGSRGRVWHAKGKWPTGHGHQMRSLDRFLTAFAARVRWGFGELAEGAMGPKDIIQRAGEVAAR